MTLTANPSPTSAPASAARGAETSALAGHNRHGRDAEHDRLAVHVRAGHEHLEQQRVGRPQQGRAQLPRRVAARHPVQQQRGTGEGDQVGQAEHEHGEPHRGPAGQRGQRLDRGRERAVDRRGSRPVLHRPGHRVAQGGQLGRRRGVRVVSGDQHPPVGGVAEVVRGPERRHQRQRGGGQQPRHQHGPGRDRPAAADRAQHQHQPERPGGQCGRGQAHRQVGRRVQADRPRRLTRAARQHRFHDRGSGHRHRERARHAQPDGDESRAPGRSARPGRLLIGGRRAPWRRRRAGAPGAAGRAGRCRWPGAPAPPRPR